MIYLLTSVLCLTEPYLMATVAMAVASNAYHTVPVKDVTKERKLSQIPERMEKRLVGLVIMGY